MNIDGGFHYLCQGDILESSYAYQDGGASYKHMEPDWKPFTAYPFR